MEGLKIGHFTQTEHGTGATVFLFDQPAVGSYMLSGSGPASHELAPLDPETSVQNLHALVLTGGSAFGLFAAKGVMRFLVERNIGLKLPHGVVPIVPAAAIYDLNYKQAIAPNDVDVYQACLEASHHNTQSGRIGAGTGATVGKIIPQTKYMTSGLGRAELKLPQGLLVEAYAVVNAVGDVVNRSGDIIAGARSKDGKFANCTQFILSGAAETTIFENRHTTLVAIFTNALFSKAELKRVAKMAIAGMARAITPIFTCYDGDIAFAISMGQVSATVLSVGMMAAEAVQLAILDAVKHTEIIP